MPGLLRSTLLVVVLASALGLGVHPASALDDTKVNRLAQAERYMQIIDLRKLIANIVMESIDSVHATAEQRDQAARKLNEILDRINWDHLRAIYVDTAIQTFTADELAGAADYFSSPVGQAWLTKTPQFEALFMPVMVQELKAVGGQ
jgi:hypothetical protein